MNGQKVLSKKEKRMMMQDYVKKYNPYKETKAPYQMDLRQYAKYAEDNSLCGEDITPEIMEMFVAK